MYDGKSMPSLILSLYSFRFVYLVLTNETSMSSSDFMRDMFTLRILGAIEFFNGLSMWAENPKKVNNHLVENFIISLNN